MRGSATHRRMVLVSPCAQSLCSVLVWRRLRRWYLSVLSCPIAAGGDFSEAFHIVEVAGIVVATTVWWMMAQARIPPKPKGFRAVHVNGGTVPPEPRSVYLPAPPPPKFSPPYVEPPSFKPPVIQSKTNLKSPNRSESVGPQQSHVVAPQEFSRGHQELAKVQHETLPVTSSSSSCAAAPREPESTPRVTEGVWIDYPPRKTEGVWIDYGASGSGYPKSPPRVREGVWIDYGASGSGYAATSHASSTAALEADSMTNDAHAPKQWLGMGVVSAAAEAAKSCIREEEMTPPLEEPEARDAAASTCAEEHWLPLPPPPPPVPPPNIAPKPRPRTPPPPDDRSSPAYKLSADNPQTIDHHQTTDQHRPLLVSPPKGPPPAPPLPVSLLKQVDSSSTSVVPADEADIIYKCTGGCGATWTDWSDVPHWSKSRPRKPWCSDCGAYDKKGPWNDWGKDWGA